MNKSRSRYLVLVGFMLVIASLLSGCLSLAEDITPPPGDNLPVQELPATEMPTLEATREPEPTPESAEVSESALGTVNVYLVDQTDGSLPLEGLEVRLFSLEIALGVVLGGVVTAAVASGVGVRRFLDPELS